MQRRCAWKAYQTQTQQKVPGLDFEFHCRDSVCTLGPHQTSSQAATSQDNRSQSNPRPETPQTVGPPPHAAIPLISRNGAAIPTPAGSARDFLKSTRSGQTPLKSMGRPRRDSDTVPAQHPQALRPFPGVRPQQQIPALNIPSSSIDSKRSDVDDQDGTSNSGQSKKDSHQLSTTRTVPSRSSLTPDQHSRGPSPASLSTQPRKISTRENGLTSHSDPNARVSYFDPTNQQSLSRLIVNDTPGDADDAVNDQVESDIGDEIESAQDILANVEEMIEGYEWASDDIMGRKMARGAADLIEARLLDELMALEKVSSVLPMEFTPI